MRRKIMIILVIIAIFYLVIGVLLLSNIQFMEAPDILVEIEVTEISSEKAVLHTIINVENPNGFDIIAKNLKMVITTDDGGEVADILIEGGRISSNKNNTYIQDINIAFNGHSPEHLITRISGEVGASILFIEKTIPLKIGVVISLENLLDKLAVPVISASINIDDITTDNINLSAEITAYNPNPFDIYLENVSAEIETDSGEKVGSLDVLSGVIAGSDYAQFDTSGWLLLKALNAKKLFINLEGAFGVNIAGFEKSLPLDISIVFNIPDLEEILLPQNYPTILAIKVDGKLSLRGFLSEIDLLINNTLKVDLALRNTTVQLIIANDDEKLLGETNIEEEIIITAGKAKNVSCEIIIPYSKLLSSNLLSANWLIISVSADLTIRGLEPSVYLEIRGYQDIHILT